MASAVRYCNYVAIDFRGNRMSKGKEPVNEGLFLRDHRSKSGNRTRIVRCPWLGGRYRAPEPDQGHPSHDARWNTRQDPYVHRSESKRLIRRRDEERGCVHIEPAVAVGTSATAGAPTDIGASPGSVRISASGPHEAATEATTRAATRYPPHRRFHADRTFHLPDTPSTASRSAVDAVWQKVKDFTRAL